MDDILYQIVKEECWKKLTHVDFQTGPFKAEVKRKHKVSICTTSMNRTGDLKQTYRQNIEDNLEYGNVEFVLLDYNSKDGLGAWVRSELMEYIDAGILNYYRTSEPEYYSMTHSRNIAFRVATGDIVNNVDGDHWTNKGFAEYVNMLAANFPHKAVFVKSKQKNRGRLGLYKVEWEKLLGGYNEDIMGYGYDDADLLHRAVALGFTVIRYGGQFCTITPDHTRHPVANYEHKDWRWTQRRNTLISLLSMVAGYYKANKGRHWGKAKLVKNFSEELEI
jgi:hypothetical protein